MSDSDEDLNYQPLSDGDSDDLFTSSTATKQNLLSQERSASELPQECSNDRANNWNLPTDGGRKKQFRFTANPVTRGSRLSKWIDCDSVEMKKFIGLLIWMGLKKLPKISDYWSKDIIYENKLVKRVMSRNRFELLLRYWNFENCFYMGLSGTDRLIKIRRFVDALTKKFDNFKIPREFLTVEETMVAFRGRIVFMQYIPGKRHKYGIKLFKICDDDCYTYDLIMYEGKTTTAAQNLSSEIVMKLNEKYLGAGRSIVTDNYYTSVNLAQSILERNTHLTGTLRKNRKGLPKEVLEQKLKKGEFCCKENDNGVLVLKWKDKREVLALSTRHTPGFVSVPSRRTAIKYQ